ncbi:ABC transporter, permease protein [Candidatus Rhodobacter oscarellae]|uniref:ABC transporter, permease protein n=2 Tax=Candidatus Rhodobacter oscarellae TaxID=1675527 RepID=A0A0J9EBZ7_9RHOB|nr:ABC transporter, permease protein [Candidatus Rhodobacter lobularis]
MRELAERGYLWCIALAFVAFVLVTIGLDYAVLVTAPWVLLALAGIAAVLLIVEARGVALAANRFKWYAIGWVVAAVVAMGLWALAQKDVQAAWPALKSFRKMWNVFEPFALFAAALFVLIAIGILAIGTLDKGMHQPGRLERTFAVNMSAKVAAVPMAFTAIGVFVISTGWTIYHSFTNSKLLPKSQFIGLDQYERLWSTNRWLVSIENLAIYGICMLIFSLVIGFVLAALMDQKIRFESVFRTIFLYPFALSFIVTGLVWQWLLTPEFGVQKIVRDLGFENFTFDPLFNADWVIYGILFAALWQGTGFVMVLMLAGLRGIDQEIWKAARVDGIPMWKTYIFIVIPMMRPVFVTALVIIAAGIIKVYDLVVAQTSGGPGIASEVPAKYVYDLMFGGQNLGQGFAASTMMLVSVLVVLIPWAYLEFGGRKRG